ncbi:hypothetical protein [Butyrivibrio sp. AC2005]|uniref:hypothetical protein n=1 Tax=Butyrivibrio sp. AC2005 TaxID=1280672 RepID=UPI0012DD335A|nr:hypothetical protein [Butyrivibrio sp. AC2005]
MMKLKGSKGLSRVVVLIALIALALVAIIVVRIARNNINNSLEDMDNEIVIAAERKASLELVQNDLFTEAVYDAENKKFVDPLKAKTTVVPYGSSKEHQGKYLLITIAEDQSVITEWVKP